MASSALDSPIEELDEPSLGIDSTMQQQHSRQVTSTNSPISMAPPPNPSMSASPSGNVSPTSPPSQDEARRALEVLMTFFKHQPGGVDPQEYITMGKLMEKLKLQSNALPGGMHSMNMGDRGDGGLPINRKRSIHSLWYRRNILYSLQRTRHNIYFRPDLIRSLQITKYSARSLQFDLMTWAVI